MLNPDGTLPSPTTRPSRRWGRTQITIYLYRPSKLCQTTRANPGLEKQQPLPTKRRLAKSIIVLSKAIVKSMTMWAHEKWGMLWSNQSQMRWREWSKKWWMTLYVTLFIVRRWNPISRIQRGCFEPVMLDLLPKYAIGDTLHAHIAKYFDTETAAEGFSKR